MNVCGTASVGPQVHVGARVCWSQHTDCYTCQFAQAETLENDVRGCLDMENAKENLA